MTTPVPPSPLLSRMAAAVALWLVTCATAQAGETVRIGCVEFPPYTYTNDSGQAAGSAIGLLTGILDRAGLKWTTAPCVPGARLMASLRDGSTQVAMLIRHPDIVDAVHYGSLPMAYLDLDAYRLQSTPPAAGMDGLRGHSVILLRGYGYGGWIDFLKNPDNDIKISYADSHEAAFRMLTHGYGRYLLDYREPASRTLAATQGKGTARDPLVRLETYFLVSRKAPDAQALLHRIEDGFAKAGAKPVN